MAHQRAQATGTAKQAQAGADVEHYALIGLEGPVGHVLHQGQGKGVQRLRFARRIALEHDGG
ncbi:hypothetical protein ACEN9F_10930 [Duganella sp. CT11-25]|uniref:hypothetical protein n=1 Tax=unclassified Duganella TaxID=2636909 RepID=UPI0039B0F1D4